MALVSTLGDAPYPVESAGGGRAEGGRAEGDGLDPVESAGGGGGEGDALDPVESGGNGGGGEGEALISRPCRDAFRPFRVFITSTKELLVFLVTITGRNTLIRLGSLCRLDGDAIQRGGAICQG